MAAPRLERQCLFPAEERREHIMNVTQQRATTIDPLGRHLQGVAPRGLRDDHGYGGANLEVESKIGIPSSFDLVIEAEPAITIVSSFGGRHAGSALHLISRRSKGPVRRGQFRYGCLINFRTHFIEHDYTVSRPHSVLFTAALKFDWVG
jgi:hypothetical protein